MPALFLTMRIVHILLGVAWGGTLIFVATFLMPSVRDAGPDGGKVMLALMRRGYMNVLPVVAVLTLVSGFWLYWQDMVAGGDAWAGSMSARVYGIGALAGLVAFVIGASVMRPNAMKLGAMMEALPNTPEGPARAALMADMNAPRAKMAAAAPRVAVLLAVAVACMAVARYL
jgi:uncharacterized membrane protein